MDESVEIAEKIEEANKKVDGVDKIRKLIRPFIAVAFVGTVVGLAATGKIEPSEILQITGMIVAFHFGERAGKKSK